MKKILVMLLTVSMVSTLCVGCATSDDDGHNDKIELTTPVGVTEDYDVVSLRDMYDVEVYSSSVNPVVSEYAFNKDQTFEKYGATPGSKVEIGDVLVYSETKSLDKQLVDMQEELDDFVSYHELQVTGINNEIKDAEKAVLDAFEPFSKVLSMQPDVNSPGYDGWAAMSMWPESAYRRAVANKERLEENLKQTNELFDLEYNYKLGNLDRIKDKISQAYIVSDIQGEVVACNLYGSGDWIPKDMAVLAVGDTTTRVLQTEYISKGNINKALDYYAIIDGKRYELTYVNMDPEEYRQLQNDGESVYTTFVLDDTTDEIPIGTYAAVVVEKNKRTGVLTVPNDAIKKEGDGYFAYLYNDGEAKYVPVTIGMRDGMYSEVIAGLSLGDKVLSASAPKKGSRSAEVTRGDYSIEVQKDGFLYFPYSEWITNPAQTGSTYLKEIYVANNQQVEKDEVIATIEVIPDQIEIDRLKRQLSRLQARLVTLKEKKAKKDGRKIVDRGLERSIAENERTTNQVNRQLLKLSSFSGIVEIKAPYSGTIMNVEGMKPGQLLPPDSNIVQIANDSISYIVLRDDKNQFNYGNEAQIRLTNAAGSTTVTGKVVSVNKMCLSKALTTEYALIVIPPEQMATIPTENIKDAGRMNRTTFKVTVQVRSEKNVLTIPKTAVTQKDKSSYVTVVNEDGTLERRSFIPGGSDNNQYWVVEGLTEGMTICWE